MGLNILFALWALVAQTRGPVIPTDDLAAAKLLYAAGTYEEALTRLSSIRVDTSVDEADQYRALCQLALGRTSEAQNALEGLVGRNPFFKMSEAEVSPRLITLFHDIRKRVLPGAVKDLYARARTSFEQKKYNIASGQLRSLMTLFVDEDLKEQAVNLADLKQLAEGFLKLSEMEAAAAAAEAAAVAARPPAPTPAAAAPPPVAVVSMVYSTADADVTPPVDLVKTVPEWRPANQMLQRVPYAGMLRIIIDETGKVESASLVEPVSKEYDPQLLAAARQWQFKPAVKGGQPVKYLKMVRVTLTPR